MMRGSKRRLSLRIALCAVLVSGLAWTGSPSALADCETVWVDVYDVELEPRRTTYRMGETALLDASVRRTDTGAPVEDALFVAYIRSTRKGFSFGGAYTDEGGHALVRLRLNEKAVEPGPATVVGRGFKTAADATCARVMEYGEIELRDAFEVKPKRG